MSLAAWQLRQIPDYGKTSSGFKGETWALTPVRVTKGCERSSEEAIRGEVASLPCFVSSARQDVT